MPRDAYWHEDAAEMDADLHSRESWSPRDDVPTPDELPDVSTRIRPGSGVPFHEAVRVRKAAEKDGAA